LLAILFTVAALLAGSGDNVKDSTKIHCTDAIEGIGYYRSATWRSQDKMGKARTPIAHRVTHPLFRRACGYTRWVAKLWVKRAKLNRIRYEKFQAERRRIQSLGAVTSDWECIHSHEGAWDDPNPPYWGGLQMDYAFQQAYGSEFLARWGTADNWPVWAQITAANRAKATRGYSPWPNTARMCGLL
jgi:hypothetical protein